MSENKYVLDVGQCNTDHRSINAVLRQGFNAVVDRAQTIDDALAAMGQRRYALVLVNRVLDADGDEGLDLIRKMKADAATAGVPVMMVSNYYDAQEQALQAGAERGFGKADLYDDDTAALLKRYLG